MRQFKREWTSLKYAAYIILLLGIVSCFLLSLLWDKHITLGSKLSSFPLLFLAFMFAFLDCTSSVVFLPYMAKYPQSYMIPFYIGEGMSGVVPSVLALSQGSGGDTCYNATGSTDTSGPRFSVGLYFGLLCLLLAISATAFHLLNTLKISIDVRYEHLQSSSPSAKSYETGKDASQSILSGEEFELNNLKIHEVFCGDVTGRYSHVKRIFIQLYLITAIVCGLGNGVIPAILAYACLPYGPTTYHLATELALLANPICCFAAFFLACKKPSILTILCSFSVAIAGVIIYTATLSPTPWLVGTFGGSFLIVALNVLWVGSTSYIKVNIATSLQQYGENALLYCGVVTQLGSCCGAIVIFLVSVYTNTFTSC